MSNKFVLGVLHLGQTNFGVKRRDSKQFVEKRRRKKREKEKKKERKKEKEEEAFPPLFSDLGGSKTGPTHFKR